MNARPILLLDVGFAATGVAVATLHDDGPHVALDVIVPERGLSPKLLNEKRACVKYGDLAERLSASMAEAIKAVYLADKSHDLSMFVVAEIPVMGSRSAGGMRSMALALACYRSVFALLGITSIQHFEFTRNDVLAACFPDFDERREKGKKTAAQKRAKQSALKYATRKLVLDTFKVDGGRMPVPKNKAEAELNDNAYDAAALLFVAREHGILQRAGWGDVSFNEARKEIA